MQIEVDPLTPGWPVCVLIKEAERIHRVDCSLGTLPGGAVARVDLAVTAEGVLERTMSNTAVVHSAGSDENTLNNTATTTTSTSSREDESSKSATTSQASASRASSCHRNVGRWNRGGKIEPSSG